MNVARTLTFPVRFLKEVAIELRQVTWPTRKETVRSTLIVIIISVVTGLYISGLDLVFTKGIETVFSLKK